MSIKKFLAKIKLQQMKNRLESVSFEFPLALRQPRKVLVCLPRGLRELTVVKQFLPTITELFKPAEVTLLSMPPECSTCIASPYPRLLALVFAA